MVTRDVSPTISGWLLVFYSCDYGNKVGEIAPKRVPVDASTHQLPVVMSSQSPTARRVLVSRRVVGMTSP